MHIMFSDSERRWMDTKKFGCPIKSGCPDDIRRSIEKKKRLLKEQEVIVDGSDNKSHERT